LVKPKAILTCAPGLLSVGAAAVEPGGVRPKVRESDLQDWLDAGWRIISTQAQGDFVLVHLEYGK
jgi:hypothetical protein